MFMLYSIARIQKKRQKTYINYKGMRLCAFGVTIVCYLLLNDSFLLLWKDFLSLLLKNNFNLA